MCVATSFTKERGWRKTWLWTKKRRMWIELTGLLQRTRTRLGTPSLHWEWAMMMSSRRSGSSDGGSSGRASSTPSHPSCRAPSSCWAHSQVGEWLKNSAANRSIGSTTGCIITEGNTALKKPSTTAWNIFPGIYLYICSVYREENGNELSQYR